MVVFKVDAATGLDDAGFDFEDEDEAAVGGHDAPSAAYLVLTLPVSSQLTGLITVFLLPLGLPCTAVKAEIMMSSESGYC